MRPRRRGRIRCWLGWHVWRRVGEDEWQCTRCDSVPARCSNCGRQHDPNAFMTICTVTRRDG